jgi:hypothetical protein
LDGTVPQGYNPKPYPKPSVFHTRRTDAGTSTWVESESFLDNWGRWYKSKGYDQFTLFVDKFTDEPECDMSQDHAKHNVRHMAQPYPNRPYEFFTSDRSSNYPPNTAFWNDTYRHVWCIKSCYNFYHPRPGAARVGDPADFDDRKKIYGDLLWIYFAGITDTIGYNYGLRTAGSPMIDAYARQNAFTALEAWKFMASGIHFWVINYGWQRSTDEVWENLSPFTSHTNGDGVWIYPGRPSGSAHDIGGSHEIPLESFRLKLFRWGAQMYEYCKLLDGKGKLGFADSLVDRMITFSASGGLTIHPVGEWEAARESMGSELGKTLSSPGGLKVIKAD